MPRITRRQKEAGHPGAKAKTKKGGAGAAGKKGGKQGFNVVPARAGKDAYLGKAQKIKADLIQRAKIKQQYAKVLAKEGMSSARLGDARGQHSERPGGERSERDRGRGRAGPAPGSKPRPDDNLADDYDSDSASDAGSDVSFASDASSELGVRFGADEAKAMRAAARAGPAPGTPQERRGGKGGERKGKGEVEARDRSGRGVRGDFDGKKGKGKGRDGGERGDRNDRDERGERGERRGSFKSKGPRVRALSPEAARAPHAQAESMRVLKKEAFGKFHRGAGGRGQPNMSARMDMLLEKIRRTK